MRLQKFDNATLAASVRNCYWRGGEKVHSKEKQDEKMQSVNLGTVNDLILNLNRMLHTLY